MQLIGQRVQHQVFGEGTVTGQTDTMLTVRFPEGEKMFLYPQAFSSFLVLQNTQLQQSILDTMQAEQEQHHREEMKKQAQWEKEVSLRNLKISVRSQGAFDVPPEQLEQVRSQGKVSTGTYLSGYSRGEPRIPDRLKPNSMCILTVRRPDQPENTRKIAGVFMVPDTFFGSSCRDGSVPAHPRYRLFLEEQDRPAYWPYVSESRSAPKWGNSAFKYLENDTGRRILRDLARNRPELNDFYRYYCRINRLQSQGE